MQKNILVLGESGTGKTHFAVQLLGRLFKSSKSSWRPLETPENLEIFRSGFERLGKGLEIEHTSSAFHQDIIFRIVNQDNTEVKFTYPDYAGEQLRNLVSDRRLNKTWQERVLASTNWILLVKINHIKAVEDIITRGMPEYGVFSKTRVEDDQSKFQMGDQAFLIELLQMLVGIKGCSFLIPHQLPQLTVMLTCWDEFATTHAEMVHPETVLKAKLPMFHTFFTTNWPATNRHIIGLSSTGRKLDDEIPDEDYIDSGPENFGYWVNKVGSQNRDLTGIISLIYHG